jgi:uncharacterized protein YprB with RNaseH-like and TPR domain
MNRRPKVLLFDIETAPLLTYVWGLWENNVGLNQIHTDWYVLSWAAKWLDGDEVMQMDQRNAPNMENDKHILKRMWKLLDEADVVITQNGNSFDIKRLNERFVFHGFAPPSSYKKIDTKLLVKKHFGFMSTKLEYTASRLKLKNQKLKHHKFSGFELWRECLARNEDAWEEMKVYNIQDVMVLEELFWKLAPWGIGVNFDVYSEDETKRCHCGSEDHKRNGYCFTNTGKYQRYKCLTCGTESRGRSNLLSPAKRKSLDAAS